MYEMRHHPLATRSVFGRRLLAHVAVAATVIGVSLAIGIVGYHMLAGLGWVDSFLNAAMLMGGMGPVDTLKSDASKLFAGCYALYCGLVVLIAASIMLAPLLHRLLHRFHLDPGLER